MVFPRWADRLFGVRMDQFGRTLHWRVGEPMATLLSRTTALMFWHLLVSMNTAELFAPRPSLPSDLTIT